MQRRKSLKRSKPLGADVEKVREFMQRGRQELKRTPLRSRARKVPQEGPLTPEQWRRAVFEASGGRCVMTGARARDAEDRRFHAHHMLPKRELRARGLFGRVWDARNGAWITVRAHERHENAIERVPAERLPASVWEFCAELDELVGTRWATQLVLRAHPYTTRGGSDGEGEG